MNHSESIESEDAGNQRSYWAFVPAGLLVTMLAGLAVMAAIAAADPGFAVEKDYYQKAVAWDGELEQRADNARLGRTLTLDARALPGARAALVVGVSDASGNPVRGAKIDVEAFPNARSGDRQRLRLGTGGYAGDLKLTRAGLWELRFTVTRGSERSTHVLRVDLKPTASGA
jgi:hypothetical protein